jgi:hypothetical protein
MNNLLSFTNCELTKEQLIARMQAHYDADELLQGATGEEGKGCTVWCALNAYDHELFPSVLGLPVWLAHLVDAIYEGLSVGKSRQFNLDWPKAIPEGADLSLVIHQFLEWLLIDPVEGVCRFNDHQSIKNVAALHRQIIDGEIVTEQEWAAARDAAWAAAGTAAVPARTARDAARTARDAARAAARAAAWEAARTAREAEWEAARAAWEAARAAAWDAAREAAWEAAWEAAGEAQAHKLISLLTAS